MIRRQLRAFGRSPHRMAGWVLAGFVGTGAVAHARVELQPCRSDLTPAQQIALGEQARAEVAKAMPLLPDDSPLSRYVSRLGQKLTAQAPGYKWPYSFHVANVSDVNAFALPGGSIYITVGLVQAALSESQLAGVLAHEIAHAALQHAVCGIVLTQPPPGNNQAGESVAGLTFLRMTRGAEQQADMAAVGILYDAGYDPRSMAQFFDGAQAQYKNGGARLIVDHPNPGNRALFVADELETFPAKSNYASTTAEFRDAHQAASAMKPYTAKQMDSGALQPPMQSAAPAQSDASNGEAVQVDSTRPSGTAVTPGGANAMRWTTYTGEGFSIDVPEDWQVRGNAKAAMLAPRGGITTSPKGSHNLRYGVMTDVYRPQQEGEGTQEVFGALVQQVKQQHPGLRANEGVQQVELAGANAQMVHGVKKGNKSEGEQAWIVGVPQNGAMRYFVFMAPGSEVLKSRKTFRRMIDSIKLQ